MQAGVIETAGVALVDVGGLDGGRRLAELPDPPVTPAPVEFDAAIAREHHAARRS